MTRICLRLVPAFVVVLLAAPLFGQQRERGQGFGGNVSAMMLLSNKGVIEELKLSDDQQDKVKSSMKETFAKYKDDRKAARDDQDKKAGREKVAKLQKEMGVEFHKTVESTLKPEQTKRLHQLFIQVGLQVEGPKVLLSQHVEKELKFTDKQKSTIKEASEELAKDREEIMKEIAGDREKFQEARKKIQAITKVSVGKATSTFTADQEKAWKDLTGAKFEFVGGGQRPKKDI
jgi:hypothetical protein